MHESGLTTLHPNGTTARRIAAGGQLRIHRHAPDRLTGLWALCERDLGEYLSLQHSRIHLRSTMLRHGDTMVSNRDRPVLTWIDGRAHDTQTALHAACDDRWARHGHYKPGRCEDRFREAVGHALFGPSRAPCPLDLFAHDDDDDDAAGWHPTHSKDAPIVLRAEVDLIVLTSTCPRHGMPVGGAFPSRRPAAVSPA